MKKIVSTLVISLLILSMVFVVPLIHAEGATLSTNKADYAPEETVMIYGSGFLEGTVTITVTRPDKSTDQWTVTSDSSGSFTTSYLLDGIEGVYTVAASDGTNTASVTFTDNGKAGTTLSATVSGTPYWTITYGWTIDKSVAPDSWEWYCPPGGSGISTYTITVTKDAGTEEAWVEGQVCVTNGGAVATENLAIVAELKDGYAPPQEFLTSAPVDVSGHPIIGPGETYCYDYRVDIPITGGDFPQPHAGGVYKVTAHVTITNHSGHLGTPFGPNPSTDSFEFLDSPTLINDVIHVDDTNDPIGSPWEFRASGSVTYDKTFTCEDEGENWNTATIVETGQSDDALVTVTCIERPKTTIGGIKYYDSNLNCDRDFGENGLADWTIQLWKQELDGTWTHVLPDVQTGPAGAYGFEVTEAGHYKVTEVLPANWVQTEPELGYYEFDVVLGNDYGDRDFGNVAIVPGHGGLTLGFWSNKNGQNLITSGDLTFLNGLNLYVKNGIPPFTAKKQIATYLLSATAVDMRWMLSAQLIATELDVIHGSLDASTMVYVGPSIYVPFPGFISIGDIMSNANAALLGTNRDAQTYWKCLLDGVNNNRLPFLSP